MCLDKRGKQQMHALFWRAQQVLKRNKGQKQTAQALILPALFLIGLLVLVNVVPSRDYNVMATDFVAATTSQTPYFANSTNSQEELLDGFGAQFGIDSSLTTNFNLPNCTNRNLTGIGIVNPDRGYGTAISIASQLQLGYFWNTGTIMKIQNFTDTDDLDSYVTSRTYDSEKNSKLCFAFGFNVFDITTNTFEIEMFFNNLPDNREDQLQFQKYKYDVSVEKTKDTHTTYIPGFQVFNYTGFLQFMTTATAQILNQNYVMAIPSVTAAQFQVAYLPLNTGAQTYDPVRIIVLLMFPAVVQFSLMAANKIMFRIIPEEYSGFNDMELKLVKLMKLQGMKAHVFVNYEAILYFGISLPMILITCIFATFVIFKNVGFFVILVLTIFVTIEYFLIGMLAKYALSRPARLIFRIFFLAITFIIGVLNALKPTITPTFAYSICVIPVLQLQNLARLADLAGQTGRELNFGNLTDPVAGVELSKIFTASAIIMVAQLVALAWLWPMRVDPDIEKPLRCWYPFTPSFWCHDKDDQVDGEDNEAAARLIDQPLVDGLQQDELDMVQDGMMERPGNNLSSDRLVISKLVKIYGKKTVVNNLSLTLFKNQILVLLGHNGAGKTTTIQMLTNSVKATSGSATAYGVNLLQDFSSAIDMAGLCPQETVLFYKLTVNENIQFFLKFKGFENPEYEQAAAQLLWKFGLLHEENQLAAALTRGQERKLQLILALMGDNRLVFLDEPTSGMDPTSRRETWDVLRSAKQNKIVVLTTHYMDEAENLADRVAIVSKGKLECCGSTLFLKDKYTKGFFIEIEKKDSEPMPMLDRLLEKYTAKAGFLGWNFDIKINESGKTIYTLPKDIGIYFEELFKEIDFDLAKFGIRKYVVRSASLEEVFIAIGEKENKLTNEKMITDRTRRSSTASQNYYTKEKVTCCKTYATFQKIALRDNKRKYCCTGFFSTVGIFLICAFTVLPINTENIPLTISDWESVYGSDIYVEINTNLAQGGENTFFAGNTLPSTTLPLIPVNTTDITVLNGTSATLQGYANKITPCIMYDADCTAGAYYVYSAQTTDSDQDFTQIAVYGNLASVASQNVLGANLMSAIANYYTNQSFTMTFVNSPMAHNKNLFIQQNPNDFAYYLFDIGVYLLFALELVVGFSQMEIFESKWYAQLMMKSGSVNNYVVSGMVADSIIFLYTVFCFIVIPIIFGFNIPNTYLPALLYVGAEIFNIYFVWLFIRDRGFSPWTIYIVFAAECLLSSLVGDMHGFYISSKESHGVIKGVLVIFAFIPQTNYLWSLYSIEARTTVAALFGDTSLKDVDPLGRYGCRQFIYSQLGCLIFYAILLTCSTKNLFLPSGKSYNLKPTQETKEDKLVQQQRREIEQQLLNQKVSGQEGNLLQCLELTKQYNMVDPRPTKKSKTNRPVTVKTNTEQVVGKKQQGTIAVNGISFGVQKGEVFGLLGVNGAGKSSTFKMLSGFENLSGGQAFLNGVNIEDVYKKPQDLFGLVGYCPQNDTINELATVKTQLHYLAELLGVEQAKITNYVTEIIERFALSDFADTVAAVLSGGNKRKLTLAIAMMGRPKIIYIDEASSGVDPFSRRQLWKAIRYEGRDSAVIMTTHAMEEAEALCQRLGVMVAGKFKCLGTLQEIKETYGLGYKIEFQLDLNFFENQINSLVTIDDRHQHNNNIPLVEKYLSKWMQLNSEDFKVYVHFVKQFCIGRLFHQYHEELKEGKSIDLNALARDCFVNNAVGGIVQALRAAVGKTVVLKFDGSYLHLGLKENKFSSGFIHGLIENLKQQFPISGYVCNHSSLDAIFNSMADRYEFELYTRLVSSRQNGTSLQN